MARFEGIRREEGSRSNTELVKSGHMAPAEKWVLDPAFKNAALSGAFRDGVLFHYEYGGAGQQDVVIPMGRVVGVARPIKDFITKKMTTTLTLPGLATDRNTIGMVPMNICDDKTQVDRFGGNQPTVITMDYVKLPYILGVDPETVDDGADMNTLMAAVAKEEKALSIDLKMPWGAVIGKGVKEGCYLKATLTGRLCKWEKGKDDFSEVVGQVLATDFNQEMWGWHKWMLWDPSIRKTDDEYINRSGTSQFPSDYGFPYDPTYEEGTTVDQNYQTSTVDNPTGIPGLHDGSGNYEGFGRNNTEYKDMEIGVVEELEADTLCAFQALDYAGAPLKNLQEGVTVKVDDQEVTGDKLMINYKRGTISIKLTAADNGKKISATYKAFHYGSPSYLDFKGVVGAVYVLLKK